MFILGLFFYVHFLSKGRRIFVLAQADRCLRWFTNAFRDEECFFSISKTCIKSFAKPCKSVFMPLLKNFGISSQQEGGQTQKKFLFPQVLYFPPPFFFFAADHACSVFIIYVCIKHVSIK